MYEYMRHPYILRLKYSVWHLGMTSEIGGCWWDSENLEGLVLGSVSTC